MNCMTSEDFPGGSELEYGAGGVVHIPTEREPRTAIFLFFMDAAIIDGEDWCYKRTTEGLGEAGGG